MRDVAIDLAVVKSRVLLIRRRSLINRKEDLDTKEIRSDMVSDESNMTPTLRAESDGAIHCNYDIGRHEKSRVRDFR